MLRILFFFLALLPAWTLAEDDSAIDELCSQLMAEAAAPRTVDIDKVPVITVISFLHPITMFPEDLRQILLTGFRSSPFDAIDLESVIAQSRFVPADAVEIVLIPDEPPGLRINLDKIPRVIRPYYRKAVAMVATGELWPDDPDSLSEVAHRNREALENLITLARNHPSSEPEKEFESQLAKIDGYLGWPSRRVLKGRSRNRQFEQTERHAFRRPDGTAAVIHALGSHNEVKNREVLMSAARPEGGWRLLTRAENKQDDGNKLRSQDNFCIGCHSVSESGKILTFNKKVVDNSVDFAKGDYVPHW